MNSFLVKTSSANYNIYFEENFNNLENRIKENNLENKKICIITDSNVSELYLYKVLENIKNVSNEIYHYTFEAGEKNKNLDTVKNIYKFLIEKKLDRKSLIIALGGGVVGDVAGFVASTFMRGIDFFQIPTTLLSQVDSSVGGKVGVDFLDNKNIVGAFYQPKFVYTNINTLKTLDEIQFSSGMGEVIKHGLIIDKDYFYFIIENKEKIKNLDLEILKDLIKKSCKIKASVVSLDEKENGIREILNFGHTFGHAIESLSNFTIPHGHCVGVGILCSINYSIKQNFLKEKEIDDIIKILEYFNLKIDISNFNKEEIINQMFLDKKTNNNIIKLIYLQEIGKVLRENILDSKILLDCII